MNSRPAHRLCPICVETLVNNDDSRCRHCDVPSPTTVCPQCENRPPCFGRARAPYLYGGSLADMVIQMKFRKREDLAEALAYLIGHDPACSELASQATCLVPIPLGNRRIRQRGYNQSAIIARRLGKTWQLPVRYLLRRSRDTQPQSDLNLSRRKHNVERAFRASSRARGNRILLIDDVITSAETARAAARVLTDHGANTVDIVAAARASMEPGLQPHVHV